MYGNTAVVVSRYRQTARSDGQDVSARLHMTDVWIRRDGRWQIVRRHATITELILRRRPGGHGGACRLFTTSTTARVARVGTCSPVSPASTSATARRSSSRGSLLTFLGAFSAGKLSDRWFQSFSIPGFSAYEANQRTLKTFGSGEQPPLVAVFTAPGRDVTTVAGHRQGDPGGRGADAPRPSRLVVRDAQSTATCPRTATRCSRRSTRRATRPSRRRRRSRRCAPRSRRPRLPGSRRT